MMIEIGELIDERYRIIARIGHGGMSEVFEATDIISKKRCAFKILREDMATNENVKHFEYEARAAATLKHPNIIAVYNIGTHNGLPYIVNEYVKGQTLREVLDFRGALSIKESCDVILQLTSAVEHVHSKFIIHCDIKTNNVFLEPDGTVKLADFGLAIIGTKRPSKSKKISGSVHYLAPEISQGHSPSVRSDIYALGVTFFELLTGRLPFEEGNQIDIAVAHVKKAFPSLRKYLPNAPKAIERIILKATRKNPVDRYASAQEMHDDVVKVVNSKDTIHKKNLLEKIFGFKGDD